MTTTVLSILVLVVVLVVTGMVLVPVLYGAPWHWTSQQNVRRLMEFCGARSGETLIDLGSGDGRIVLAAARDYGLKGIGIEIDPLKVRLAEQLAEKAGVADRTRFHHQNVFDADYSEADILYIYMSHQALDRLFPALIDRLKPGARVVCHRFCIRGQTPDRVSADKSLFLYTFQKGREVNRYS